jgi:hypothetical protein
MRRPEPEFGCSATKKQKKKIKEKELSVTHSMDDGIRNA